MKRKPIETVPKGSALPDGVEEAARDLTDAVSLIENYSHAAIEADGAANFSARGVYLTARRMRKDLNKIRRHLGLSESHLSE